MKNFLNKNINSFKIISAAEAKCIINIIPSKDDIGGFYKKNIILPKNINLKNKRNIKKYCYIYKILFSLALRHFNFYLNENKENVDYLLLSSILISKKINKHLFKNYLKLKNIVRKIYPIINKNRLLSKKKNNRALLLEIILKKFTYEKIKNVISLKDEEKILIFEIENIKNLNDKNLLKILNLIYIKICNIYKNYENINLYILWGYLYSKNKTNFLKVFKNNIQNKIKSKKNSNKLDKKYKNINNKESKEKQIYSIFDYKKTYDEYNKNNKPSSSNSNISNIKNLKKNSITQNDENSTSFLKTNIINEINLTLLNTKISNINKLIYKEWDFKKKEYKYNWCYLYVKKSKSDYEKTESKIDIKFKKDILIFKNFLKMILNKKIWKYKEFNGEDLDLDSIVDNYKDLLRTNLLKIFKTKKKINKDISFLLLLDSSLSTDSYIKNEKIIEIIKTMVLILSTGLNDLTYNFSICTFNSNTRYDCRYTILKDFNENFKNKKNLILKIMPQGYTRIGPALRHSINILKKNKSEKKIIILISDGKPTDYDEYEGSYGLNDIKQSFNEAHKNKIQIKMVLINDMFNKILNKILKKNDYFILDIKKKYYLNLIKMFEKFLK